MSGYIIGEAMAAIFQVAKAVLYFVLGVSALGVMEEAAKSSHKPLWINDAVGTLALLVLLASVWLFVVACQGALIAI